MEIIKGTLEGVSKKDGVGKESGKPYTRFIFVVDGKNYSCFNADMVAKVKIGEFVEMHGEQDGQYFNMKSIAPAQDNTNYQPKIVVPQETEVFEKPKVKDTGYHLTIEQQRSNALDSTIEVAKMHKGTPQELSNKEFYELVKQNFEWINRGIL